MTGDSSPSDADPRIRRRNFLAALGAGTVTAVAGCTDSGGDGDGSDTQFVYAFGRSPTEIQWNIYRQSNFGHSIQDQTHHYIAKGDSEGGVWPDLPDDFSVDGKTLRITFPEDHTWWSGDDLTAEDYWTHLEIQRLQNPEESAIANNTLVDDYTIDREFKSQVTPRLMVGGLTTQTLGKLTTPRWIYDEYLESLQDASNQDARDSVMNDLQEMQIPIEQLSEDGLGNGPYEVVEWNDSETIMELYEDHPDADGTNITNVKLISSDETENLRSLEVNDELDMSPQDLIGETDREDYPDNLENWYELDWFRTQKITFNWENEHLAKRPVRRAIANALDLEPMVQAAVQAGLVGSTPAAQSGLRSSIHERYLGEGWVDNLIDYPTGADEDAATTLLQDAGYSLDGDTWQTEDGDDLSFSFLTSDGQHQNAIGVQVSDQLESFGIGVEVTTVGSSDYYQSLQNYNHDMFWIWHVAAANWHPTAYFSNNFYGVEVGDPTSDAETGPTGIPLHGLTIPEEVGAREVSGEGREINPAQLMEDLPVATSEDEVQSMTRDLVQWFNYDLPGLMWIEELSGSWGDTEDYEFPDHDPDSTKLNMDRPGETALMHGWINRREE